MNQGTLFVTCLADTFFPRAARAAVRVLNRLGFRIDAPPGQTCCGQPMFNAGHRGPALEVARRFLEVFSAVRGPVITPSSSCAAMVRNHFPTLFREDPARAEQVRALASRTFEFSEFLFKVKGIRLAEFGASFPESVTFHRSCHFRALGLKEEPVDLIRQIPGIRYHPLDNIEECCGFGGTFSLHFPHVSEAMVKDKVNAIRANPADWLIYADPGCAMNLMGYARRTGAPLRALHLTELVDRALGGGS